MKEGMRDSPSGLNDIIDREDILPYAATREGETGKLNDLCSS